MDAGAAIVEVLMTHGIGGATRKNLDSWITTFKLPVTSLIDVPGTGTVTLDTYGRRENAFIVELKTMKIVKKVTGSTDGSGDSSVKVAAPDLLRLLK